MSPIFGYAAELYATMRADFELTVEAAYQAAEEQTGGAILNRQGRAEGIDPYSLMTGPWSRVVKYGTPELIEWAEEFGRPSVTQFEREWFAAWLGEEPLPEAEEGDATERVVLGFDGSSTQPALMVAFPRDPNLTAEMRKDLIQRFRDAQGLYPVFMDADQPEMPRGPGSGVYQHAADC